RPILPSSPPLVPPGGRPRDSGRLRGPSSQRRFDLLGSATCARRTDRLVGKPARLADRPRSGQDTSKSLVDRRVRREGGSDLRLQEDEVARLSELRRVFAPHATLHRGEVILGEEVVILEISLAHRSLVLASSWGGH